MTAREAARFVLLAIVVLLISVCAMLCGVPADASEWYALRPMPSPTATPGIVAQEIAIVPHRVNARRGWDDVALLERAARRMSIVTGRLWRVVPTEPSHGAIVTVARSTDYVCRYGSEVFVLPCSGIPAAAETWTSIEGGHIVRAEVLIYLDYWSKVDHMKILLHELGHACGLDHSPAESDLMYSSATKGAHDFSAREISILRGEAPSVR